MTEQNRGEVEDSVRLAQRIRPVIRGARADIAAAALSYELAGVLAREGLPAMVIDMAIDQAAAVMKLQVRAFGSGKEHP